MKSLRQTAVLVSVLQGISTCKSVGNQAALSGDLANKRLSSSVEPVILMDVNDVSILVPNPKAPAKGYLRFTDQTVEGPLLSKELFIKAAALANIGEEFNYESWAMAGVRIDNCAKLLIQLPCQIQIRPVFQPLSSVERSNGIGFDDQALHLPFDIHEELKIPFFKDFLELKKSALPDSSNGPIGVHPILAKQGMEGVFAQKLNKLILKYALASRFERFAAMGTVVTGKRGVWTFAASQPIKDFKVVATPIPCQAGETLNVMSNLQIDPPIISMGTSFSAEITPTPSNCGDLDVTQLTLESKPNRPAMSEEELKKAIDNALAINDPTKVFFASTTCVNCHVAARRVYMAKGQAFLTLEDGNPFRYKAPDDVSKQFITEKSAAAGGAWSFRAFGWNDTQNAPAISLYTFNDTMRVAHEVNDMIRAGKLD